MTSAGARWHNALVRGSVGRARTVAHAVKRTEIVAVQRAARVADIGPLGAGVRHKLTALTERVHEVVGVLIVDAVPARVFQQCQCDVTHRKLYKHTQGWEIIADVICSTSTTNILTDLRDGRCHQLVAENTLLPMTTYTCDTYTHTHIHTYTPITLKNVEILNNNSRTYAAASRFVFQLDACQRRTAVMRTCTLQHCTRFHTIHLAKSEERKKSKMKKK